MASIGKDLATIREQKKLTLEDIHDSTKIPLEILQAIEDGSIFTDFDENKTYVRSYIRSYGKELGLKESVIIEALDDYEIGSYSGKLLQEAQVEDKKPSFTFDDETDESTPEEPEEPDALKESEKTSSPDTPATPPPSKEPSTTVHQKTKTGEPPSVSSVDWANLGRKFSPLENRSRIWMGAAIILIIVSGVIAYLFFMNGEAGDIDQNEQAANTTQNLTQPAIVPDSLQLNLSDSEDTATTQMSTGAEVNQTLSDTLHLLIYAAYERLDPVRVHSNVMAEFNPYWIEQGQAYRFEFTDFIRIRGPYSRMELLMNGHPIENFSERFMTSVTPDSQYVEIPRSLFENDNKWLQAPPDSTDLNFSPPSTIIDRPKFPIVN